MTRTILTKSFFSFLLGAVVLLSACNDNSGTSTTTTTGADTTKTGVDSTNTTNTDMPKEPVTNSQY